MPWLLGRSSSGTVTGRVTRKSVIPRVLEDDFIDDEEELGEIRNLNATVFAERDRDLPEVDLPEAEYEESSLRLMGHI